MLRSDAEIERLQQAELKDDLSNAQKVISSLSTNLYASDMTLNMVSEAIEYSMQIMASELSLALADYNWPSVKTRVREESTKAYDILLDQNDLKKEVGNTDSPKQTLNRQ
eukprot:2636316-Ditylum_brightwellii.AAC.1